jgi:uncharacterized membrane protein YfhO
MFHKGREPNTRRFDLVLYEHNNTLDDSELADHFNTRELQPPCGSILNENRTLNYYEATVRTNRSCLLLFKMSYHPDWHVEVNGNERTIYPVSPSFMAVPLKKGFNIAQFYYEPDTRLRYWLIAFGVIVLVGILLYDIGRRNPSRNT